jgi:hypothetical protein
VLKWLRNKPKLVMQCSVKKGSSKKKARPAGVGTDLIEKLSRQCAIDADIGAVDSDDDIEVNEGDDE